MPRSVRPVWAFSTKKQQHHRQRNHPAQIAKGKARPGKPPDFVDRGQAGQQGVGEDGGEFHPDQPDPKERDGKDQVGLVGHQEPQPHAPAM